MRAVRTGLLAALVTGLLVSGCRRPVPAARPSPDDSARVEPASLEEAEDEAARLRERGPTITEYDRSPRILWTEEAQRLLTRELAPVLEAHGLPAATAARYWLLVGADGHVWDVALQAQSRHPAFDRAAARVGRSLRFSPASREGRPVAAWVLREVSLLMQ